MKKICLSAAAALMFASCAKDIVETPSTTPSDDTEKGYVTLTFTATHPEMVEVISPEDGEAATKTALQEDGTVKWAEGDQLRLIIEGDEDVTTEAAVISSEDGKTATFKAKVKEGKTVKYVVYPSDVEAVLSGEDLNVTIPKPQDGTFEKASIEVGTVGDGNSISLQNVCSLLKFTVANDNAAKVFIGGNGAPFAGTAKINSGILAADYTDANDVPDYIPNVEINVNGAGTYYAAVLPAKTTGLSMQIYDGSNTVLAENISSNVLDAKRKTIKDLGTLRSTPFNEIRFVSKSGSGSSDGKTWETAWSPARLFSALANTTTALNHHVIIVEGGDMKLTSSLIQLSNNTKFKMYGGYPEGLTGRDITSRDLVKNETNFSGYDGTPARIFNYNGTDTETVIDGIGFCNTYQSASGDLYTGTALLIGAAKTAYFVNCRIFQNTKDGNAIVRVGGTSAKATFERCIFSDNTVSGKGLLQVQAGGNLTIRDCDFSKGNKVSGETADAYKEHYRVCYKTGGTFTYEGENKFAEDQFIPTPGTNY